MLPSRLYTVEDIGRLTGTTGNHKLVKALVRLHGIPHVTVGEKRMLFDEAGVRALKARISEWNNRPRLNAVNGKPAPQPAAR